MRHVSLAVLVLAGAMAAGCATSPSMTTEERLALYRQHAGAPVMTFRIERMVGTNNWTPLGDQAVVLWTTASRGYLLEMRTRCSGMSMASRMSVTNRMGVVTARVDSVLPRTATGPIPIGTAACRIETIRPLDARTIRDARRELREANYIEQSEAPPSTDTPADGM